MWGLSDKRDSFRSAEITLKLLEVFLHTLTLTTPLQYLMVFVSVVASCFVASCSSACQTHHDLFLAARLQNIPAGIFTPRHPTRGLICLNTHTRSHTHTDTHTYSQLKPSCHASVMGRSATATAMKDNIIKLDISGGKANSLSTVIRVMHWHSPPRGRFNCVQTSTHTLTCKQTHTHLPGPSVCVMPLWLVCRINLCIVWGGCCFFFFFIPLMPLSSQSQTQYMLFQINSVVTLCGWTFPWCIWLAWLNGVDGFIQDDRWE